MIFFKSIALVLLVLAIVAIRLYRQRGSGDKRFTDPQSDDAEAFRQHAIKIHVDYALCTIHDSSYSYEDTGAHGRVAAMNVLSGNEMSNVELRTQSQLLVEYPYSTENGETRVYQIPIYGMTRDSFDMRFMPDDIYLYIDRSGEEICLLDMGERHMWGQRRQG